MPANEPGSIRRNAPLAWLLATLGMVPVVGIIFGLIALEWGMRTRDKGGRPLAFVAAVTLLLGIAITIAGFTYRAEIFGADEDPGDLKLELPRSNAASKS